MALSVPPFPAKKTKRDQSQEHSQVASPTVQRYLLQGQTWYKCQQKKSYAMYP